LFNNDTGRYEPAEWLEKGIWVVHPDGDWWIIPDGVAEIEGPDTPMIDKLNALCRQYDPNGENVHLIPVEEFTKLGLYKIPDTLKRFDVQDGYYHA
jgi:hypothetical protein